MFALAQCTLFPLLSGYFIESRCGDQSENVDAEGRRRPADASFVARLRPCRGTRRAQGEAALARSNFPRDVRERRVNAPERSRCGWARVEPRLRSLTSSSQRLELLHSGVRAARPHSAAQRLCSTRGRCSHQAGFLLPPLRKLRCALHSAGSRSLRGAHVALECASPRFTRVVTAKNEERLAGIEPATCSLQVS